MSKRNINISFVPPVQDPKTVRFAGTTFGDLKRRLSEAKIPGLHDKSYLEVYLPTEARHVCLLDDEELSMGDLFVNIFLEIYKERLSVPGRQEPVPGRSETGRVRMTGPDPPLVGKQARWMEKLDRKLQKREAKAQDKLMKIASKLEKHRQHTDPFTHYGPANTEPAQETGSATQEIPATGVIMYPTLDANNSIIAAYEREPKHVEVGVPIQGVAGHGQPVYYGGSKPGAGVKTTAQR